MKYYVTYILQGSYTIEVEANNITEAEEKADPIWQEADFGDADEIDGRIYKVSSKGVTHYEF